MSKDLFSQSIMYKWVSSAVAFVTWDSGCGSLQRAKSSSLKTSFLDHRNQQALLKMPVRR